MRFRHVTSLLTNSMRDRRWLFAQLMLFCGLASMAWACNVPVYRYALDHWHPDDYQGIIVHHGDLTSEEQTQLAPLTKAVDTGHCNLHLKYLDMSAPLSEQDRELVASLRTISGIVDVEEKPSSTPAQLVIRYPASLAIDQPMVTGDLTSIDAGLLLDSPTRRELLKRLSAGQSAVWLVVGTGDAPSDDLARSTVESELLGLQGKLELPKLTDDPDDKIEGGPALRVEFSTLYVERSDPSEQALLAMLLGSETDLRPAHEPLVFPIFARGRALWPLVGAGINAENIRDAASFVIGACSCQVKEQNPGFDLLLTANWDELLPWAVDISQATSTKEASVAELVAIPAGSTTAATVEESLIIRPEPAIRLFGLSSRAILSMLGLFGVVLLLVVVFGNARRIGPTHT